jgi:hypothetical protein
MPGPEFASPYSLVLSFEQTAGPLPAARAPFDPGTLVRAIWLRAVRLPGVAGGFGGTVVERAERAPQEGEREGALYRARSARGGSVRDVVLPLSALDELARHLRAAGLPDRVPNVRARVDTSDGWIVRRLSVSWDDLPPVQFIALAMSSGYDGPDGPAVEGLFAHLVALSRDAKGC